MEEQICIDYNENLYTIAELAKKYKRGTDTIRKILKKNSCYIRNCSENSILKKNKNKYTLEEIEKKVIDNYKKGYGLIKSGRDFNLTQNNVKYILKKHNITIRNFSEAAILSNENRALNKNSNFFSVENRDMAWVLGFLASDGNISKNKNSIKISLSKKDKEILEKIKELIQIENPIRERITNNGFDVVTLEWTCLQHKRDLQKYNIVPNKTFILKPPYKLNRKYWIDYIRGYFDGDGSINLIKNSNGRGNGNLRWQVCSATKEILDWIVNYLYEDYNIPKINIYSQMRKSPLYYIQYSSTSTRKIYKALYNESNMFLKRKKEHFEEILNIVKPL